MKKDNHNDFENQGWDAMVQSLDREMPVEKKRRGFLWLAFFIGLTAFIGGGFWYVNTKSPVKTIDKTESKAIVDVQISKNTEGVQNTYNIKKENKLIDFNKNKKVIVDKINKDNNSLSLIENNKIIDNKDIQINNNHLSLIENNKIKENNFIQNNNSLNSKENIKAEGSEFNQNNSTDLSLIKNNINDLILNDNNQNSENKTNFSSIELLNKIKIAPISIERDTNELKYIDLYVHPLVCVTGNTAIINNEILISKTRLGITTGMHTEKGQKTDGFQAGLVIFKPLIYHWSLSSGLNFRQTQTFGDSISYFKTEYLANASVTTNLQSGTPISLDKLYYLEVPISIQYKLKRKFAFSTGLKTSYLIGQSVKENGTAVYFVKSSFTSQNSYDLLNKVNTKTLGLNRWDISLMGGFSYLPSKHIQLGLRYDLGFTNIINRTNWHAYNRYLSLNAVYLF